MTQQTLVRERTVKTSIYGSGREHYHVILSKSRGLDRVIAVSTFNDRQSAQQRAYAVKAEYGRMQYAIVATSAGSMLQMSKAGQTPTYLMTRQCSMKHQIDG